MLLKRMERHAWPLGGFLFLTLFATHPIIFKISSAFYGPMFGTDNRAVIWHFWWLKYSWLHHLPLKIISVIAYPFGVDISAKPAFPVEDFLFRLFIILTSDVTLYNCAIIFSFVLSAIFVYWFVFYFTKNKPAAFLSGLIFSFSPYHFNKVWEHFSLGQLQWVGLYAAMLIFLKQKPCFKNALYLALAFTLVVSFDFSYPYIMLIFTVGFLLFLCLYQWRIRFKSFFPAKVEQKAQPVRPVIGWIIGAALLSLFINLPVLWPIFKRIVFKAGPKAAFPDLYMRPFHYLFSHSARPFTYFFPPASHPVFGHFTRSFFGSLFYGRNSIEHTLYIGFVPLFLAYMAVKFWKQKRIAAAGKRLLLREEDDFLTGFFLFSAFLGYVFSMPPYIDFGLFKLYFPSFFLYNVLPMFRSYARFGIIVILSVSILAGFGLAGIFKKIRTSRGRSLCFVVCLAAVLFEFTNIPPFRVTEVNNIPEVYAWLAKQPGDIVIAEYPMIEGDYGETKVHLDYLFYQRIHQKKLVNGASGITTRAFALKKKILKVEEGSTARLLKKIGTDYVIIHEHLYRSGEFRTSCDIIGCIPNLDRENVYCLVKTFGTDKVYTIGGVNDD